MRAVVDDEDTAGEGGKATRPLWSGGGNFFGLAITDVEDADCPSFKIAINEQ